MIVLPEKVPILGLPSPDSKAVLQFTWTPDQREEETRRLWKLAICLSVISFFASLILCVAGIVCASLRTSASTAAFAADCLLDALTSVIVFWRYFQAVRGREAKEDTACIWLGGLLVVSSLSIIFKAVADIITQPESGDSHWLLLLSISAAIVFVLAAGAKYWLYKLLLDASLLMDAVNTLFSGLFCAVVAITVLVIDERPDYWYLDPVEGGLFGLFMGVYGVKCIVDHVHSSEKDLEKSVSSYILIP